MKTYEKESLLKNFWVFFSLLELLLILLFIQLYHSQKATYKQEIFKTMQVCSYTFACEQFHFDFAPKSQASLQQLYENNGLYSYFSIPKSEKYYLKISYPAKNLLLDIAKIERTLWIKFIVASLILSMISLFFTFYSLKPIRKALQLNDEFIKDILHDFNTPITSMVLNIRMFKQEYKENIFVEKISHSIDTILLLQNNLKSFLFHSPTQSEHVNIATLAKERMQIMQELYPRLTFIYDKKHDIIKNTHKELLTRILDNLLSNAAKYNKPHGEVRLTIDHETIMIEDTGKGIKQPKKALQRYYKEQTRGLGLGLHIVQKLTEQLHIMIEIDSVIDQGTRVSLDFSKLPEALS